MDKSKPPVGIMPRWRYEELQDIIRIKELSETIMRYRNEGLACPSEWGQEILQLSLKSREETPK